MSDQAPGRTLTSEQLIAVLRDIIQLIEHDDSYGGSITYEAMNEYGKFTVSAAYRHGNYDGQGGVTLIQ